MFKCNHEQHEAEYSWVLLDIQSVKFEYGYQRFITEQNEAYVCQIIP